jgi:multisubunit Na+/H+ antiporter MnhC subunit
MTQKIFHMLIFKININLFLLILGKGFRGAKINLFKLKFYKYINPLSNIFIFKKIYMIILFHLNLFF